MLKLRQLKLSEIVEGDYSQRTGVDEEQMAELASSIGRIGLINPITVAREGDKYIVVAGHRRLEACRRVGLEQISSLVLSGTATSNREVAFAENLFRADLSPVEQACAIKDALDSDDITPELLAVGMRRSEIWISRQLALLDWPADILEAVHTRGLSVSAASNLALISDNNYRNFLLTRAVNDGATARTTAAWLQGWRSAQPPETAVQREPLTGSTPVEAALPQRACICCSTLYRADAISLLPICTECFTRIRDAG